MKLWGWWRSKSHLTREQRDMRQVHLISRAVVSSLLADVGEPVLHNTLRKLSENKERKGEADYTSLAEIWITAKKRCEELRIAHCRSQP